MPKVPVISEPSEAIAPADTTFQRNRAATREAFGAGVAEAVSQTGQTLQNASSKGLDFARQKKAENDERDAKRMFLDYSSSIQEDTRELFSSRGQKSLDIKDQVLKRVDEIGKEHLDAIQNNRTVSRSLGLAIQQERLALQKRVDNHIRVQEKIVDDNQYEALRQNITNDGIEAYKSFGADAPSQFDSSFDGNPVNAFDDRVLVNEVAIRRLAEDKARRDGEIPEAKVAEAVADYYDSIVRAAAAADGNASTALKIFNGSRDKIPGDRGVKLKEFLKDKTTGDVALAMAREVYKSVSHLPVEQRLAPGLKQLSEIKDRDTFVLAEEEFKSQVKEAAQIEGLAAPARARETVMGLLSSGFSAAEVKQQIINDKGKTPIDREAELNFLDSFEKINEGAKKDIAENVAGQIYRMEDDNVGEAERRIKELFKDDHKSQGFALAELKKLSDVDEGLLKTDLPSRADKTKKEIIDKVAKQVKGRRASVAELKGLAIIEAENIEDPEVKTAVIPALNSYYGSLEGFETELAQDAGADLVDKVSKTNAGLEDRTQAIIKSDSTSKVKASAIADLNRLHNAAQKDEKARVDKAKTAMAAAMAAGMSPDEFRASSPENAAHYDLAASDGTFLSGMVSVFRLAQEGKEFPFTSHPSATNEIREMSDDDLVNVDLAKYKGLLNRNDTNSLASRKRSAIAKRETKNARVAASVTRNINRLQPYTKKGKPKLTKGVLAKVDNYVWSQIADMQEAGKNPTEEDVKKMVIAAFTVVEFTPDDPGFFESVFGLDRGGKNKDVAGAVISEMSDEELKTLKVDEDNFPAEMSRFLDIAVEAWKKKNPQAGEPTEDDLEILRGNVLKFILKNREK